MSIDLFVIMLIIILGCIPFFLDVKYILHVSLVLKVVQGTYYTLFFLFFTWLFPKPHILKEVWLQSQYFSLYTILPKCFWAGIKLITHTYVPFSYVSYCSKKFYGAGPKKAWPSSLISTLKVDCIPHLFRTIHESVIHKFVQTLLKSIYISCQYYLLG